MRYLVLLDLNGTMCYRSEHAVPGCTADATIKRKRHYLRRGIVHFLTTLKSLQGNDEPSEPKFTIVVCSSVMRHNILPALEKILPEWHSLLDFIFDRDYFYQDPKGENVWDTILDLEKVWTEWTDGRFTAANTIILNNQSTKFQKFPHNGIVVPEYGPVEIQNEVETLLTLLQYLVELSAEDPTDVRTYMTASPFISPEPQPQPKTEKPQSDPVLVEEKDTTGEEKEHLDDCHGDKENTNSVPPVIDWNPDASVVEKSSGPTTMTRTEPSEPKLEQHSSQLISNTHRTLELVDASMYLHNYCQYYKGLALPQFTSQMPTNGTFVVQVELDESIGAPVFTGIEHVSKKLAKASASLVACVWLYRHGLLNHDFRPRSRTIDRTVNFIPDPMKIAVSSPNPEPVVVYEDDRHEEHSIVSKTGTILKIHDGISYLSNYCQATNINMPVYRNEQRGRDLFITTVQVQLPDANVPPISGIEQKTKQLAKGYAALMCCRWLYEQKYLNDDFRYKVRKAANTGLTNNRASESDVVQVKHVAKSLAESWVSILGCHWIRPRVCPLSSVPIQTIHSRLLLHSTIQDLTLEQFKLQVLTKEPTTLDLRSPSGLTLTIQDSIGCVYAYCQACRSTIMPEFTITGSTDGTFIAFVQLPGSVINQSSVMRFRGSSQPSKQLAKGYAALAACAWLLQHQMLDDDFRAKLEEPALNVNPENGMTKKKKKKKKKKPEFTTVQVVAIEKRKIIMKSATGTTVILKFTKRAPSNFELDETIDYHQLIEIIPEEMIEIIEPQDDVSR